MEQYGLHISGLIVCKMKNIKFYVARNQLAE